MFERVSTMSVREKKIVFRSICGKEDQIAGPHHILPVFGLTVGEFCTFQTLVTNPATVVVMDSRKVMSAKGSPKAP